MHNLTYRLRIACFIIAATVAAGGLTAAKTEIQDPPQRPPMTEEERRRIAQRLLEELRGTQAQPAVPVPQPEPGTQPPVPSIVQRAPLAGGQIQLSFDNQELYEFINTIASTLGITPIIIDPEVRGSVTIHSSAPMPKEDLLPLFSMILKNNNAALVMQGAIYQIVPISAALKRGLDIIEHTLPPTPATAPAEKPAVAPAPPVETPPAVTPPPATQEAPVPPAPQEAERPATRVPRLATHVIRVEFVPVRDLMEPLRLFMTDGGIIMPYERLNLLIVTDYTDSVSRVIDIIRLLDDSYLDPDLVEVIEIKYNKSADVLEDLRKIFGTGGKDSATGVYFVSLDRLNAVLVMANSKRALAEVKRWIDRLDSTAGRNIQTFVYTVENSTASNIAMILSMLFGGEGGSPQAQTQPGAQQGVAGGVQTPFGQTGGGAAGGFGGSPYQGGQYGGGFGQQGGGFGGSFGGGFSGAGQQLGPRLSQGPSMSAQILRGGVFSGLQDVVRVVADDINNSLIIQASAADYAYILEIMQKMDVMPRQVLIDARIFEVDLTDALSFGIAADLQARASGDRLTTASMSGATGALTANTFGFVGNGREILLALDALRSKTNVRILEAPSVLALDGTVAKIVVGGEVPYPGTSYVAAAGGATTSVQYRDTGVALIIMPRISASGTVTLEIAHELSSPGAQTPTGPTFNKTSVSTTLAVKDGETVAIAGLIRESDSRSRSGVPFLSEIPLIGALFGRSTRSATRSELLILITPHVIRTPERFQEMTQELRDSLRHVRRVVDNYERDHLEDMEDARKKRQKEEERRMKNEDPPKIIPPR